ncbi:MAG TPA: SpoIIE family protein phosphatase [Solirubrobacteraceae bacterium]|nr:SpoIIE family protein phosphatase [Solirubrobacteraceae bacterium]
MDLGPAHAILETAHSAFASTDQDGRITFWNRSAEDVFRLGRDDAVGRSLCATIIPERDRPDFDRELRLLTQPGDGPRLGTRRRLTAQRADGREFPAELTISALRIGPDWGLHAFIRDVSELASAEYQRTQLIARLEAALHGSERRFAGIVDALAEAVTIRDLDDRIIYANRAALDSMGFASLDEMTRSPPSSIMDAYIVTGNDGREIGMDDIPSVRLLRGQQPGPLLIRTVDRADGAERWRLLKAAGLTDANGRLEAAVTIIEDVTSVKQAEVRTRLLAEASQILASSLDYEQTLRNVAWLAVPRLADWCSVDLVSDLGDRTSLAVAHTDPAKLHLAERLRAHEPERVDPDRGLGRAMATGLPELYPEITDEMLAAGARNPDHLELLREIGMSSVMIVPLTAANGRTFGAMTLVNAESRRRFDKAALSFASQIADRAAIAVENARLYTAQARIAATLQKSLLPDALPQIDGWEVSALYRPVGEGVEVGGDFYDVFEVRGGWLVLIGDITGKGVAAAAMTAFVRHSARIVGEQTPEPAMIIDRLDAALRSQPELSLCSLLCLRVRAGRVTIGSAGHPLPLLVADGSAAPVGQPGPLLGAFADSSWLQTSLDLEPGQTLVLYTDGVTDTVGADGRFGDDRLLDLLGRSADCRPADLLTALDERLTAFQVGPQADDTAALALRRQPSPASG